MGGFTTIKLKDCSEQNIAANNARMELTKVPKKYRFYSENDIIFEYEAFKAGIGVFRDDLFPKDKIKSLDDFKKYWNPKAVGLCFVPEIGMLTFDCYFGRTSKRAMRKLALYLVDNYKEIESVSGSFSTFMERGMTKLERQLINESNIKGK
jgi:hypothetical protein